MADKKCDYCDFYGEESVVDQHIADIHLDDQQQVIQSTVKIDNGLSLDDKKAIRVNEVQQKTEEKLAEGVTYNSKQFSVSASAKTNWLALVVAKDSLTYPYNAPTGFNDIYAFTDATDLLTFFNAGITFVATWETSNEQLKISINACSTEEELNAITDDR